MKKEMRFDRYAGFDSETLEPPRSRRRRRQPLKKPDVYYIVRGQEKEGKKGAG